MPKHATDKRKRIPCQFIYLLIIYSFHSNARSFRLNIFLLLNRLLIILKLRCISMAVIHIYVTHISWISKTDPLLRIKGLFDRYWLNCQPVYFLMRIDLVWPKEMLVAPKNQYFQKPIMKDNEFSSRKLVLLLMMMVMIVVVEQLIVKVAIMMTMRMVIT